MIYRGLENVEYLLRKETSMIKNFVFDTNVLLTDPHAPLKFGDNNVVIPITVLEELDKFKRDNDSLGQAAREATRLIDRCRSKGSLSKGAPLESGGTLRVMTDLGKDPPLPFPTLGKTADGLILAAALLLRKRDPDHPVVFVTRDINLRLRADAVGLKAVSYEEKHTVPLEEIYTGWKEFSVARDVIEKYLADGSMSAGEWELFPNQSVVLKDEADEAHCALGRYHADAGEILPLVGEGEDMWGIRPRNQEQSLAIDLLLDRDVSLVTLMGKAGTGKTLLAIAAGMRMVADKRLYSKMVVARPIMPLGKELGFLPGAVGEKMKPWMEPVFDNLELIAKCHAEEKAAASQKRGKKSRRNEGEEVRKIMASGVLEVQPLTYIRGRSLPGQYLVIDEAQNLTHHEVKTIITRAGEGTKVVMTGDPYQIDNPFIDATTSGLSIASERFKSEPLAGHITLSQGERSPLAEMATNLL